MIDTLDGSFRPRLTRGGLDRILGGVCGGIGAHLAVSGWWLRIGLLVLIAALPLPGVLLYLLAWVIIPAPTLADQPGAARPRPARAEATLLLGVGVILVGLLALAVNFGFLQGKSGDPVVPVLLALLGLALLARQIRRV